MSGNALPFVGNFYVYLIVFFNCLCYIYRDRSVDPSSLVVGGKAQKGHRAKRKSFM